MSDNSNLYLTTASHAALRLQAAVLAATEAGIEDKRILEIVDAETTSTTLADAARWQTIADAQRQRADDASRVLIDIGWTPRLGGRGWNPPTPEPGVVTRVARALNMEAGRQRGLAFEDDWDDITEQERDGWRLMARAALAVGGNA